MLDLKGKLIKVIRKSRSKTSTAEVGTIGYVYNEFTTKLGTQKLCIYDDYGASFLLTRHQCEVINDDPLWSLAKKYIDKGERVKKKDRNNNGYPIICFIKKKTEKAALVRSICGKEIWVPISIAPEINNFNEKSGCTFFIPMWFAKKNKIFV